MKKVKRTTFGEYAFLRDKGLIESPTEEQLAQLPKPERFCGRYMPDDLNGLTMGQLAEIISCDKDDMVKTLCIITGATMDEIIKEPYERVVGLLNFATAEIRRIGDMFKQLDNGYTKEELEAGVEDLNFGIFGTIDWYARRMGITDHDAVMKIRWIRIWQCAMNDGMKLKYERKYNEIITRK